VASYLKPKSHKSGASINDLTTSAKQLFPNQPTIENEFPIDFKIAL
jgi:hypothetical protein